MNVKRQCISEIVAAMSAKIINESEQQIIDDARGNSMTYYWFMRGLTLLYYGIQSEFCKECGPCRLKRNRETEKAKRHMQILHDFQSGKISQENAHVLLKELDDPSSVTKASNDDDLKDSTQSNVNSNENNNQELQEQMRKLEDRIKSLETRYEFMYKYDFKYIIDEIKYRTDLQNIEIEYLKKRNEIDSKMMTRLSYCIFGLGVSLVLSIVSR